MPEPVAPVPGPSVPHDTIETLRSTWQALSELGEPLNEAQWKRPSGLPGWTVQDVYSHLIGTEALLQGEPSAPATTTDHPHVRNAIGAFNESEVEMRRQRPGSDVLREWNNLRRRREQSLDEGDAAYFAQPMATPTGPGTMADFLSMRILDCWLHEQDLRRALGQPGNLSGPAAEHTVDRLVSTIPIVVGKRARCPDGAAVTIRITGGVERDLTYEVRDGRAVFLEQPTEPPLCVIEMDTEAFIMLATGRVEPDAPALGVAVDAVDEAGRDLADRVIALLNMMI